MSSTQHLVEKWTSRTLRLGVWSSGVLMVAGILWTSLQSPSDALTMPTISEMFSSRSFDAMSFLILGLLLLMLTPILRVLTAIVGFVAEKDWTFTAISLTVFLMLLGELVYSLR